MYSARSGVSRSPFRRLQSDDDDVCDLIAPAAQVVCVFSGRPRDEVAGWFSAVPKLCLVAENGYYFRPAGGSATGWETLVPHADFSWKKMALPILQVCTIGMGCGAAARRPIIFIILVWTISSPLT